MRTLHTSSGGMGDRNMEIIDFGENMCKITPNLKIFKHIIFFSIDDEDRVNASFCLSLWRFWGTSLYFICINSCIDVVEDPLTLDPRFLLLNWMRPVTGRLWTRETICFVSFCLHPLNISHVLSYPFSHESCLGDCRAGIGVLAGVPVMYLCSLSLLP